MKRLLLAIPLAVSLAIAKPAFASDYEDKLYELNEKIELGFWTHEDYEFARDKLYEYLDGKPRLEITNSTHIKRTLTNFNSQTQIISKTYSHYFQFIDQGNNGLIKGTNDEVYLFTENELREYQIERIYKLDSPGKYFVPTDIGISSKPIKMDLDQWHEDVDDLIQDYQTAIMIDYYLFLRQSDNGKVWVKGNEMDLLN